MKGIMILTPIFSVLNKKTYYAELRDKWLNPFVTSGTYVPLTKSLFKSAGITVSQRTWKRLFVSGHICPAGHEKV